MRYNIHKKMLMGYKNNTFKWITVTKKLAAQYIRTIAPVRRRKGTYCENCSILIGEDYDNKKYKMYNNFYVCLGCEKDLRKEMREKKQKSAININDSLYGHHREIKKSRRRKKEKPQMTVKDKITQIIHYGRGEMKSEAIADKVCQELVEILDKIRYQIRTTKESKHWEAEEVIDQFQKQLLERVER